jgi:hypothetical protein
MTLLRAAPAVLAMAFLGAAFSPNARADEHDKKTTLTFSGPVEIPGVHLEGWGVLPAGTYVFKLLNSSSDRHIVQIFNQDQTQIYATILAIPNYRLRPTDKTVITFNEGIRGAPEAIRAWFYPGDNWGEEFVYPKARAVELAKVTNLPVLAHQSELAVVVAKPDEPRVVAQLQQTPVKAVQPTGEVVEIAQVVQTTPQPQAPPPAIVAAAPPAQVALTKLPDTASNLPLLALCGFLALGGAFALRSIRRRV